MLWRKMLRDLWENKLAYLACAVVIAIGVAVFTLFSAIIDNLTTAKNTFYRDYNLADGFAEVAGIPYARIRDLARIKGVDEIEGRIVRDLRVLLPGREEAMYLRLVSVRPAPEPDANPSPANTATFAPKLTLTLEPVTSLNLTLNPTPTSNPDLDPISTLGPMLAHSPNPALTSGAHRHHRQALNAVKLIEGQPLSNERKNILIDPDFFEANALSIGDELPVIADGKKVTLEIVGVGQSPEFVYVMPPGIALMPSPETFGIAYIPLDTMETIFRGRQLINSLIFTVSPGHTYGAVEDRLRPALEGYGLKTIFPREDLVSALMLREGLRRLRAVSRTIPVLFLLIAAAILYITIKRLVEQQRTQIGTMKAFGYPKKQILLHYVAYSLLISFSGGAAGALLGGRLSIPMTYLFLEFMHLPYLETALPINYFFFGVTVSGIFGLLAGYQGSKGVLKLPPAEAMRPPPPLSARKTLLEKMRWLWSRLSIQVKMAARNLSRNRQRSFFVFLGIMFSFYMMAVTWYFHDLVGRAGILDFFDIGRTYNVRTTFFSPVTPEQMERELYRIQGVEKVEPVLEIPATFRHKWREESAVTIGLIRDAQLFKLLDETGDIIRPPAEGIILSKRLAALLSAEAGSLITMETAWDKNSTHLLKVIDTVPQYLGLNAYMEQGALSRLLNYRSVATTALMSMERDSIPLLVDKYRESALVASVTDKEEQRLKHLEMVEALAFAVLLLAIFAAVAGFAITYNASIVSFSERKRELASLRVLGMSPKEVFQVINFEQWFISFFGMLAGIPATIALVNLFSRAMSTDIFTIPVAIEPITFLRGFAGTTAAIWLAQYIVSKKINSLSLVEVLKERD